MHVSQQLLVAVRRLGHELDPARGEQLAVARVDPPAGADALGQHLELCAADRGEQVARAGS